jgi:transcriptional regulator with XRE-family HTH domain
MNKRELAPTYIREWRKHRGLTLRALAERVVDADGEQLTSYVSLGRIERGIQPYSQPILEALAKELGVTPAALLERRPEENEDLISLVSQMDHDTREQAMRVLQAISKERK